MAIGGKMETFLASNIQIIHNAKFYSHKIKLVYSNNFDISGTIYQI